MWIVAFIQEEHSIKYIVKAEGLPDLRARLDILKYHRDPYLAGYQRAFLL